MAFKGTSEIGSRDWRTEEPLLRLLDEAFYELRAAREEDAFTQLEGGVASDRVRRLQQRFESLQAAASQLTIPNAFGAALQNEGGSGLNASTSQDQTK